jgi:conjugal transfer ATP-binding protein TraC
MIADLIEQARDRLASIFATQDGAKPARDEPEFVDMREPHSRIADWLPYIGYLANESVFVNKDTLGFVLEVTPQTGATGDMATTLKGLYARLPVDAGLQIQLWASPNIKALLKRYSGLRMMDPDAARQSELRGGRPARNSNVFRTLARMRYAHMQQATSRPLASDVYNLVRDFRSFVSVTVPGSLRDRSRLDELITIRAGALSSLRAARFTAGVFTADDLIGLVGEWLNPARLRGRKTDTPTYDDTKSLADQIIDRDTTGDWSRPASATLSRVGGKDEDEVELRFLSVQKAPKTFALWGMNALVGDMFQDSLQIPCPFLITMGVSVPDQSKIGRQAVADKMQAERGAKGDLAKFSPDMVAKNEDWDRALKAINVGGGNKWVWNYHQLILFAKAGDADASERALVDLWAARGFDLVRDGYIHRAALLQSMPMALGKPMVDDLHKLKRIEELRPSGNTIHLSPLIAEGKGTGTPTLLGVGRRGQIAAIDFYDNTQAGKNVAIAGDTGSGKSTLLQEIALSYASKGALVRVFEKGMSFVRLTDMLDGVYLRFSRESRPRVNPFSMVSDQIQIMNDEGREELVGGIDDDMALLQPLLAKMASPDQALEPPVYASLALIIKEEYMKKGRAMTVTDVMLRYKAGRLYENEPVDQRYLDMAVMLSPFSEGGAYASYFQGPSNLDFSNPFLVFETQELSGNPHLMGVVQMILLYRVCQEFLIERHRQKVFIMDEAKDALAGNGPNDKILGDFLEALWLRVRKYNGCAIAATQDVAHYFASTAGKSIWNQSAYVILGKQSEASIAAIERQEALQVDEHLKRLLSSISSSTGTFREWYIHSELFKGVIRLVLDPATLLLMSNRAEDNVPMDAALARGLSISEAIQDVLAQRGVKVA